MTPRKTSCLVLCAVASLVLCGFDADGCSDSTPKSDSTQQAQQEQLSQQSNAQIGMPGLSNFTEKKIMRRLYEMRDKNVPTFSYMVDMQGRLHHLCDSMGYGLPYGTQYSNPEKHIYDGQYNVYNLPQSEPNGLFMPPSAEGTWVICASTKGEFTPIYVEPRVIVSPFRLRSVDDYAVADEKNEALKNDVTQEPYVPAVK